MFLSGLGVADLPAPVPDAAESATDEAGLAELAAPGDKDMLNDRGELRNLLPVDTCDCTDEEAVIISRLSQNFNRLPSSLLCVLSLGSLNLDDYFFGHTLAN